MNPNPYFKYQPGRNFVRIIILLFSLICFSCESQQPVTNTVSLQAPRSAVICGFVADHTDTTQDIVAQRWDTDNFINPYATFTTQTTAGSFLMRIPVDYPKMVSLNVGDTGIGKHFGGYGFLLSPGDSLFLQIDDLQQAYPLSGIRISGTGAEAHRFLVELTQALSAGKYQGSPLQQTIFQRVAFTREQKAILDSTMEKSPHVVSQSVKRAIYQQYSASMFNLLARFFFKEDLSDAGIQHLYRTWVAPYFPQADTIPISEILDQHQQSSYLHHQALLEYLIDHNLSDPKIVTTDPGFYFDMLRTSYQRDTPVNPMQVWMLTEFLVSSARYKGWNESLEACAHQYYQYVATDSSYDDYRLQVEQIQHQLQQEIAFGNNAKNFSLLDAAGNTVQLQDFKGKVMLLDFMLFGCYGCYQMVPHLSKLQDNYRNNDQVVFISISVDHTQKRFLQGIGKFSPPGSIHLYTGGQGADHAIIQQYLINSFPTLVVIDGQGKIIAPRAPDPRTPEGFQALQSLIEQGLSGS